MIDFVSLYARASFARKTWRTTEAIDLLHRCIALRPERGDLYLELGIALQGAGRMDEAVAAYLVTLRIDPRQTGPHVNIAMIYHQQSRYTSAMAHHHLATRLDPLCREAWNNFGLTLQSLRSLAQAESAMRQAIQINPNFADAYNNLGCILLEQGRQREALQAYTDALAIDPQHRNAEFNRIYASLNVEDDPSKLLTVSQKAAENQFGRTKWFEHVRRDRAKPRLGLISADFRRHPVGNMIIPTIEYLARNGFEIVCYTTSIAEDNVSERFQACARWVHAYGRDDESLSQLVYADEIDILFDLSGYTAGNRLGVFARKPAPIQISWFAYPATTGMRAMDYAIGDHIQTPEGIDAFWSEKLLRMPLGFAIAPFEPPADDGDVGPLPALTNGYVIFGSFNMVKKITPETVALWSRVLNSAPGSRMIIKATGFDDPCVVARFRNLFGEHGVKPHHLSFLGYTSAAEHRAVMRRCDIALDTYPYTGGVTTLECLWSGLPVITMAGAVCSARHSACYLAALDSGLTNRHCGAFESTAVALARNPRAIARLRREARDCLRASPLCDLDGFGSAFADLIMGAWNGR